MKVGITLSEQEILKHISQYGPKTGYELGKETSYSEKTCYQGVKNLVDKELLSVSVIGETKAGMDKKEYSLTVLGLATALLYPQVNENLRDVIRSWNHLLPLVLGKWHVFVDAGVKDLAKHRLMNAAVVLVRAGQSLEWEFAWETPINPAEIFLSNFYYFNPPSYDHEKRLKWAEACKTDPKIREYSIEKLRTIAKSYDYIACEATAMVLTLQGKDED